MPINSDKLHLWKADIARSIDFYNDWFLRFAPGTYRKQRVILRTNDPLINLDLEKKQLAELKRWLLRHGYKQIALEETVNIAAMPAGTFTFRNALSAEKEKTSNDIPADCIVKPVHAGVQGQPIVIEAKSTGNATSAIRRRKQDPRKFAQLKKLYGENVKFILLLCGNFDPFYLGCPAAEGIDWVWQHRLDDLRAILDRSKKQAA